MKTYWITTKLLAVFLLFFTVSTSQVTSESFKEDTKIFTIKESTIYNDSILIKLKQIENNSVKIRTNTFLINNNIKEIKKQQISIIKMNNFVKDTIFIKVDTVINKSMKKRNWFKKQIDKFKKDEVYKR